MTQQAARPLRTAILSLPLTTPIEVLATLARLFIEMYDADEPTPSEPPAGEKGDIIFTPPVPFYIPIDEPAPVEPVKPRRRILTRKQVYPRRLWSRADDEAVMRLKGEGVSNSEIGRLLERTSKAIGVRAATLKKIREAEEAAPDSVDPEA